jgi:excisionase family DNA binding protein
VQSTQNQTSTGNESYEQRERRDLLQRITDFYLRFGYVPMFFGEPGQAAPAKRSETEARKPEYMTAIEAAAYVGVHPDTLRRWVRLTKFPCIPLPGKGTDFRFSKALIDEWAKKRALGVK